MLRLRDINRVYRDGQPVHALRSVDLDIAAGDYVMITGPSGSGKTSLLNVLGLLDVPDSGSYQVDGVETAGGGEALRSAIRGQLCGFVFQAFHLLPGRTARENVELGMLYGPHPPRQRRALAAAALERVGLSHRMDADPSRLSGGEKQRVAIARAVAPRPRILFSDEPTGNLDSGNTANVLDLLRQLNDDGLTLVVVTHDEQVSAQGRRQVRVVDGAVTES